MEVYSKKNYKLPELTYHYTKEDTNKVQKVAKIIFACIVLPVGIYLVLRHFAYRAILCATFRWHSTIIKNLNGIPLSSNQEQSVNQTNEWMQNNRLDESNELHARLICNVKLLEHRAKNYKERFNDDFKLEEITIKVDGHDVHACVFKNRHKKEENRWVLGSLGAFDFMEQKLPEDDFLQVAKRTKANAIVFNYPGVGLSSGPASREISAKAYRAVLDYLENSKENGGAGAKEIIGHGYSLGAAVQGEALEKHAFKEDIKYVFVKQQTFSTINKLLWNYGILGKIATLFINIFRLNIDASRSSQKLIDNQIPEIIVQTATDFSPFDTPETNSTKIIHDGVIPENGSLAKDLVDRNITENKRFLFTEAKHEDCLYKYHKIPGKDILDDLTKQITSALLFTA